MIGWQEFAVMVMLDIVFLGLALTLMYHFLIKPDLKFLQEERDDWEQ